jgi:S1-C subfamily serine protease
MIRLICPQCHKAFGADEKTAANKPKCPQCGVALAKAAPLGSAVSRGAATGPDAPGLKQPSQGTPRELPSLGLGRPAPAAGSNLRPLVLPLCIGGGVLVTAVVVLTLLAAGYLLRPQTASTPAASASAPPAAQGSVPEPNHVAAAPAPPPPAPTPAPAPGSVPQPVPAVVPAAVPAAVPATVPAAAAPAMVVDVLRQLNLARDSARGPWTFLGRDLASPRNEMGVLRLPVTPSTAYRLTVVVQRMTSSPRTRTIRVVPQPQFPPRTRPPTYHGRPPSRDAPTIIIQETPQPQAESDEGMDIVLSIDGHPAALVLDGFQRTVSGLELIDGKGVDQNGTAFRGEVLPQLRPVTVICTVGPGSVDATVDGRTVVHWTGQSDLLGLDAELAADVGNSLALVSSAQFHVQRIELVSLGGSALPAGPPAVAAPAGPASTAGLAAGAAYPAAPAAFAPAVPAKSAAAPSHKVLQCVALIEHPMGSGSGFAVGNKLVVTNAHVVEGVFPDEIKVEFGTEGGKAQPITRILYFDRSRDLCVIEMKTDLAGLPVRDDYTFHAGDRVTLVGNPSAGGGIVMRNAVNQGRFSNVVHIKQQDFYQIEASVNPGWSGGPVLDAEGKVVAIVAMKANDRIVTLIRGAEQKLDQDFRTRIGRTAYNVGLTYGIPASALADILKDPALRDEDRQAEANDKCAAKTLADRLSFLAELSMLHVMANVPSQVRTEARLGSGKTLSGARRTPPPGDAMAFMSEFEALRLGQLLDDEKLKSMESAYRNRLEARLGAVRESEYLPESVKHDIEALATKIREANKFAEHPATTYTAFSAKVKGLSRDIKEHLKRLAENLKETES